MAAIDVGSSATRVVVARPGPKGPIVLWRQRVPLRLGTEVFAHGSIGPASIKQLTAAFVDIAKKLNSLHVVAYRAVATSALRDAANSAQLLAEIAQASGIVVQIITGVEEAELMRRALLGASRRHGLLPPPADALLLDLGGGSLELMRADGSQVQSLPLGTVRLLGRFPRLLAPMSALDVVHLSEDFVRASRMYLGQPKPAPMALGTGGNIEAMAQGLPGELAHGVPTLSTHALLPAACSIGPLPLQARATSFGLAPGRADLLLPAVLIVHAVALIFGLSRFCVPGGGIRDALLDDLLQELTGTR